MYIIIIVIIMIMIIIVIIIIKIPGDHGSGSAVKATHLGHVHFVAVIEKQHRFLVLQCRSQDFRPCRVKKAQLKDHFAKSGA